MSPSAPGTDYDGTPLPTKPIGRRAQVEAVQSMLLDAMATKISYWYEQDPKAAARLGIADEDLDALLKREARRALKYWGWDEPERIDFRR